MRKFAFECGKSKLLASVMLAALVSACSSDASRFSDDPFGNPFRSSSRFDPASTGSVRAPSGRDNRLKGYDPVSTGSVTTQNLSAPAQSMRQSMPAASAPIISSARPSVSGLNPAAKGAGFNPGVAAANYPSLAPVAQRSGTALASSTTGWSAVGGTPVTLGQGDSVTSLSSRYGVPASAILAVNGLNASSRVSPGQQLMIPAYNAVQGRGSARPVAAAAPLVPPKPVVKLAEMPRSVPVMGSAPKMEAPKFAAPARQVGAATESEAEKRAAAKLRELKGAKPVQKARKEETPQAPPKAVEIKQNTSHLEAEKLARLEKGKTEKGKTEKAKAEKAKAEKARLEKAQADKLNAEKLARLERLKAEKQAKADKLKAEKIARTKKPAVSDDELTTASIPATRMPVRAPVEPKMVAKAEPAPAAAKAEPKEAEPKETASSASFRWPARGRVISGFGSRGTGGTNEGINIAVPEGTPVRAAEGGTVVHADDALKGYGKMVLIRHPNGYVSVYAHNGDLNVKRGQTVKRGQVIAHSGNTGNVTSPQLHFELRKGSTPVDPSAKLTD